MNDTIAIDIDLGKITVVSAVHGVLMDRDPLDQMVSRHMRDAEQVLVEIAGPVMHAAPGQKEACPYGKRRWMLYNVAVATSIGHVFRTARFATSTDWTQGYDEAKRHAIAGMLPTKISKSGAKLYAEPHDIRECRAMLYFHSVNPKPWKPLHEWLEGLL